MASSSTFRRSYQVFLSFRGKDIRKTFIDHLYTALDDAGIWTFKDDEELDKGENIEAELQTAILESRIAIIVFSENYASSRWCLDELVRILECKKNTGQKILPVFYQVEPSQVRNQRGSFAAAFTEHEERWTDKVPGWKEALREVADLGGMELKDEYESKFIKKIVEVVEDKLKRIALIIPPYLIGISYRVKNILKWLKDDSSEAGILTIHGAGGIGKTTIAKIVYNMYNRRFETTSFLPNVRETLEKSDGLLLMYEQLLSDLLKRHRVKISNLDKGINMIRDVMSCKKVLLVIDDVDQKNRLKLDPLLGMHHLFHPGSKIIVTTRQKRLLKGHKFLTDHEIEALTVDQSLKLFCWHAFGQDHPSEGYLEQSVKVVSYCKGLPLALHVLGSSLYGEIVDVWKCTLEKLKEIPNREILEVLRVSFDSLPDDHDRNLFLEIACFFIGEEKSHVVTILNECDFHTTVGLESLVNRSLLKIDENNKLIMHQLVRDMGREIVRQESPNKPGQRSRLWHHKDSFNVLKQKTGTETIEGLMLNMDLLKEDKTSLRSCNINNETDMDLKTDAFMGMHNLRLLHINNVQIIGGYKQFPKKLRFLCWHGRAWSYVPRDFPLENLVVIEIHNSNLKQLSTGIKILRHVKILNLSHCHGLVKTPEFSQFPSLERLILEDCTSLVAVHESIVEVDGLLLLNLKDCKSLRKLPSSIGMLKVLETLIISGCSNLEDSPINLKGMKFLKVFCANGISLSTSYLTTEEETSWHSYIWSWVSKPKQVPLLSLDSLPHSLVCSSLANCNLSNDAFPRDFSPSLQKINLSGNPIYFLPDCVRRLARLNMLNLSSCKRLQTLIGLPSIETLSLSFCTSLEKLTFQSPWRHTARAHLFGCVKLVDMEGIFNVVPIGKINPEMLNYLGLHAFDLESMKSIKIKYFNDYTNTSYKGPIQGVYEYGFVFSIFLPGDSNVPDLFPYMKKRKSLSFTVPRSPPNARLRGLTLRVVYALNGKRWTPNSPFIIVLSNKTKGMKLDFYPAYYAIPGEGEDIIWLSHWNFRSHHFEAGDEMRVVVRSKNTTLYKKMFPNLVLKEVGIHIVYEDEEQMGAQTNNQEVGVCYEYWTSD